MSLSPDLKRRHVAEGIPPQREVRPLLFGQNSVCCSRTAKFIIQLFNENIFEYTDREYKPSRKSLVRGKELRWTTTYSQPKAGGGVLRITLCIYWSMISLGSDEIPRSRERSVNRFVCLKYIRQRSNVFPLCLLQHGRSCPTPSRQYNEQAARQQCTATERLHATPIAIPNDSTCDWVANQDSKSGAECVHSESTTNRAHVVRDTDDSRRLQGDEGTGESTIE